MTIWDSFNWLNASSSANPLLATPLHSPSHSHPSVIFGHVSLSQGVYLFLFSFFFLLSSYLTLFVKKVEEGEGGQEITNTQVDFLKDSLDQDVFLTSYIFYLVVSDPSHYPYHVSNSHGEQE